MSTSTSNPNFKVMPWRQGPLQGYIVAIRSTITGLNTASGWDYADPVGVRVYDTEEQAQLAIDRLYSKLYRSRLV